MKKKKTFGDMVHRNPWVLIIGVVLALAYLAATNIKAADEEKTCILPSLTGLDSVEVEVYADTNTVPDTTYTASTFPDTSVVTITDTTWWLFKYIAYWNGSGTGYAVTEEINRLARTWSTLPGADSAYGAVTAYIDVGSGLIDTATGAMVPREKVRLYLSLIGGEVYRDSGWAVLWKEQIKKTDSLGRCEFRVPANTVLDPPGSYYELSFKASRFSSGHVIRTFQLDTIPDPINIMNATEVR